MIASEFDIGPYLLVAILLVCISAIACIAIAYGAKGYIYGEPEEDDTNSDIIKRFE